MKENDFGVLMHYTNIVGANVFTGALKNSKYSTCGRKISMSHLSVQNN